LRLPELEIPARLEVTIGNLLYIPGI